MSEVVSDWPEVSARDAGIRPAGPVPDEESRAILDYMTALVQRRTAKPKSKDKEPS